MSIVFKARVLLELGAELISSDAVALYELIKNGIDAGSRQVFIEVTVAMQPSAYRHLQFDYRQDSTARNGVPTFLEDVEDRIVKSATEAQRAKFLAIIGKPQSSLDEGLAQLACTMHEGTDFHVHARKFGDVGA